MGLFDVQAVCNRIWGRENSKRPFLFLFWMCGCFWHTGLCVDEAHFLQEFKNEGLLFCVKLFSEQNVQYAQIL